MNKMDKSYPEEFQRILDKVEKSFNKVNDLISDLIDYIEFDLKVVKQESRCVNRIKEDELFQFDCFIRTAKHLLTLSEEVVDLIQNVKEKNDVSYSCILSKTSQFNTLFQHFIFPYIAWVGKSWDSIINIWHEIREEFLMVKLQLDIVSTVFSVTDQVSIEATKLIDFPIKTSYGIKKISVVHGNLCKSAEEYDVVVCSAYKNGYVPTPKTLIGSLLYDKNISVFMLAKDCELDFRKHGAWLSKEIDSNFHRIACIELLEYSKRDNIELINLKSIFSTLNYLIEQAAIAGISVKRIALPIIGAGHQKMDTGYILSPLVTYCLKMLQYIEGTEEIIFYEQDEERANYTVDRLQAVLQDDSRDDVFISYSSKQFDIAMKIYNLLTENSIKCWMAPQSIPAGSQYYLEIPKAINSIKVLLLLLTQDAINSHFVPKEVSASLGAGKLIIPLQVGTVRLENGFDFLLEGEQIKFIGEVGCIDTDCILQEVNRKLITNH